MKNYDVIVVGGGTAGCSAAYNASKLGLNTILIEKSSCLGGSMTNGLVIPVMQTGANTLNTDFYKKLIAEMHKLGGQISYQNNQGWFNPELLKICLDKILIESGVKILFNTEIENAKIINNKVEHVEILNKMLSPYNDEIHTNNIQQIKNKLSVHIGARYIVDSTGDLNFCQKIGCEFLPMTKDFQPMSLRFIMSGIKLDIFGSWLKELDSNRKVTTVEQIDGYTHLSTAYTWDNNTEWALAPIFDEAVKDGILKDTDRNYFQVFSVAGTPDSLAFNCPRLIKNYNPNSFEDVSNALIEGRQAIYRIAKFCNKYFPGFENAYISNIANTLGVRSSNRIKGKYIYTIDDLRSGKTFETPVLVSEYPVDVHSREKNSSTLERVSPYQLPIESLMSANFDNVFVAGRGISADEMAQGALRVQANCFSMGEAVAKYIRTLI